MKENYIRYCHKDSSGSLQHFCTSEGMLSLWSFSKKKKAYKVEIEVIGNVEDLGDKRGCYFGVMGEDYIEYIFDAPIKVQVCFPKFPKDSEILVLKAKIV